MALSYERAAYAKRGGWVQVESGGGRHVNAYQLVMPSRVKP
jgi:hypothetical protein